MKTNSIILLSFLFVVLISINSSYAQEEKASIRISLEYYQTNNGVPTLKTLVRTRSGRRYEPVQGVIVNLFLNEETKNGMMGNITTDESGRGEYILPDKFFPAFDTLNQMTFIARVLNDPNYEDKTEELEISKSILELQTDEEDSAKHVTLKLVYFDESGDKIPMEEVDLKLYVKRMLGNLPVGGDYIMTDENGEAVIEFPNDIPGDKNGMITIIGRLENHDELGNVEMTKEINLGIPLPKEQASERTLWAPRDKAPLWLLIFPNLLLLGIWAVIFYLIFQLYKINKEGKTSV